MVTDAVAFHEALVVTRRGQRHPLAHRTDGGDRQRGVGGARVPDPDPPLRAVGFQVGHQHVAARLQQEPPIAAFGKPVGQVVHHRALADGAQVQLRVAQRRRAAGYLQAAIVDALECGAQGGLVGQRAAVIEIPQPGDRQHGWIERAAGRRRQLHGPAQGGRGDGIGFGRAVAVEPRHRAGGVAVIVARGVGVRGTLERRPVGAAPVHRGPHHRRHGAEFVLPNSVSTAGQPQQPQHGANQRGAQPVAAGRVAAAGQSACGEQPAHGARLRTRDGAHPVRSGSGSSGWPDPG